MANEYTSMDQILEAMDDISASIENQSDDIIESPMNAENVLDDQDLMDELNKIFTPVLVSQGFEKEIADKKQSEITEAGVLTEKNIIAFDEPARMSQLISVCALLLAKKKNSPKWQIFVKAAAIKKQSKIDIQKEEYDNAKALAQKYLVMVSTTNNSSVARDAATDLLPQTQH